MKNIKNIMAGVVVLASFSCGYAEADTYYLLGIAGVTRAGRLALLPGMKAIGMRNAPLARKQVI